MDNNNSNRKLRDYRNEKIFKEYHFNGIPTTKLGEMYGISREAIRIIINNQYEKNQLPRRPKTWPKHKGKYYYIELPILRYCANRFETRKQAADFIGVKLKRIIRSLKHHNVNWRRLVFLNNGAKIYQLSLQGLKYREIADKLNSSVMNIHCKLRRYCKIMNIEFPKRR